MKCFFCNGNIPSNKNDKHLVVAKSLDTVHVHGDLEDKETMKKCIEEAIVHTNTSDIFKPVEKDILSLEEVVFKNRQRIGDMLMFTCAIRDFKKQFPDIKVNVLSTASHIWDHNPYLDLSVIPKPENIINIGPGRLTNSSNRIDWHFANAFRVSIEDALNVRIEQGESRPDIWFTKEEYDVPPVIDKPYWIICIGGEKGWGCKMYPYERWQRFVEQNPDITFVQIGTSEDNHPRLVGTNVIDYIGKTQSKDTGVRDLFKLFLNAEGSIGLVSFHMHLSGALNKPCIVVAGAREPVHFTRYQGHNYLSTEGQLPCAVKACWHCDINACKNLVVGTEKVPKCVDMILPEDISRALQGYYLGGRLSKNVRSLKPKVNIAKEARPYVRLVAPVTLVPTKKYEGFEFGGGSLTDRDWNFIHETIKKYNVKSVLEFGAGLSTLLLNDELKDVVTYEDKQGWIDKVRSLNPKCDVRLWDRATITLEKRFDLAFVDGPSGGASRQNSTSIARLLSDIVIIHDANREYELKWQEQFLKTDFDGPIKGGHRCHLWIRKKVLDVDKPKIESTSDNYTELGLSGDSKVSRSDGKFIKFVSTARGWGGCARSVTTIMKHLVEEGHTVEFIPFRNAVSSREFKQCLETDLKRVKVNTSYDAIKEPCDVLYVYADDFVWEFPSPLMCDVFKDLQATKKIMMCNYRLGDIGKTEWTRGWGKYMFLNSIHEKELLKRFPGAKTKVLPPCTELADFFNQTPDYTEKIRIVRHNSQGDTKFSKDVQKEIDAILESRSDVEILMMPGPSFVTEKERFKKFPKNNPPVAEFLAKGNLFWYSLPEGYMDAGPRTVIEAMAVGLPILADNWGGVTDRITPECGWLCSSKKDFSQIIKTLSYEELKQKGINAKERAKQFTPEAWVKEIIGNE